jgi:Ala-tRNA(Pro) deacylase
MTISTRLNTYLKAENIDYELVQHSHSQNSISSASSANVPAIQLAKAVILEDHEGRRLMAVIPAINKVSLNILSDSLNRSLHLVKEQAVYPMFKDCEHGAIPPVAAAYNMDVVYDDQLLEGKDIYFEAGDHSNLVHVKSEDFSRLVANAKHLRFSHEVFH